MKEKVLTLLIFVICYGHVFSQEKNEEKPTTSSAQANNPLANMTAINFQNYYVPKLTDAPDEAYLNTTWVRFAKPFAEGKLLMRVSAPFAA